MNFRIIKYELERLVSNKILKCYFFINIIICLKSLLEFKEINILRSFNLLEGVISNLNNQNIIIWMVVPFSLYFMTNIFFDFEINNYIKIRSESKLNWFIQKIISLFIYNCITIGILLLNSFVVSLFLCNLKLGWSHLNLPNITEEQLILLDTDIFPFQVNYTPFNVIVLSIFFLVVGMTLLGLMMAIISLLTNNSKVGLIIGYSYFIFSTKFIYFISEKHQLLKNFTIDGYILFQNHNFNGQFLEFFTIKESIFRLNTLLILFFFIGLYINKKLDISQGG